MGAIGASLAGRTTSVARAVPIVAPRAALQILEASQFVGPKACDLAKTLHEFTTKHAFQKSNKYAKPTF